MSKRYISDAWSATDTQSKKASLLKIGDYVLGTKYRDGDPSDHFCVGFYAGSFVSGTETRYLVTDENGNNFRANGFRRVAKLGSKRGEWIVNHLPLMEASAERYSVWHWYRASWAVLAQHP